MVLWVSSKSKKSKSLKRFIFVSTVGSHEESSRPVIEMVKVRMNTADVAAEVKCLRRLIGMRCSNVYDLSPKVRSFFLISM